LPHFVEAYADKVNELLHDYHGRLFYKQEIMEIPGLLTSLIITYDGVRDDIRNIHNNASWEDFLKRMSIVKSDWAIFDRKLMEQLSERPEKLMAGYEGRTLYFIKGGNYPQYWTEERAECDIILLMKASVSSWGEMIYEEVSHLDQIVPVGRAYFREYEHYVRVIFNYLFFAELGEGQPQSRTEPENEGVEIRDIIFANRADSGFWKDLKEKYRVSEVVIDANNTNDVTRDDLRQLYCYLKPALGFWGFIVCRTEASSVLRAFNRTLYQNFSQQRGLLILCDDDLRRMVEIKRRGQNPSNYLQERMSEFIRSI
jgi:hypothetical protein